MATKANQREASRRRLLAPRLLFAVSLACAAAIGLVLYVASTSLPYLALSPTTDPTFGAVNQCLMAAFREPRVGFALSQDGSEVATWGGSHLARCSRTGAPVRVDALSGIQQATYDGRGVLWMGTREGEDGGERLRWLFPDGGAGETGQFSPVAMTGSTDGVVLLDAAGKLVSLGGASLVRAVEPTPAPGPGPSQLTTNDSGDLVALVANGGVWIVRANSLERVRGEAPCDVEFLWWTKDPRQALLSCGPRGSFALSLWVPDGRQEAAPRRERARSAWISALGQYVQPCDGLPCTAPAP